MDTMITLPISAVERETGISKEVLRKWEARYGFPAPLRDAQGERGYPLDQVARLQQIKRLLDAGMRPAKLMGLSEDQLEALASQFRPAPALAPASEDNCLALLRRGDVEGLRQHMNRKLMGLGLESFVLDILANLNETVGDSWARGELDIQDEHLYTENVQRLLCGAIASLGSTQARPRILLTTLPGEQHALGIQMLEALLTLRGAQCISLGTQTPLQAIVGAGRSHQADVVALSFSIAFPARQIAPALSELRRQLEPHVELWAGGAGMGRLGSSNLVKSDRISQPATLEQAVAALDAWRQNHAHEDIAPD